MKKMLANVGNVLSAGPTLKNSLKKKMVVSEVNVRHCPLGFVDKFISFGF